MSESVIEVTRLEDLDLDSTPGCEIILSSWYLTFYECICNKSAVARVQINHECGSKSTRFVCKGHLADLKADFMECVVCGEIGGFRWKES